MRTQSLNLRSFGVCFLLRVLRLNFSPNNKFPDIIFLCQVEEFADFAGSFGAKAFGMRDVGEAREVTITLFDDDKGEDSEIRTDDTTTDGFSFTFAIATGTVARVAFGKEETNTCWMKNTLRKLEHRGQ